MSISEHDVKHIAALARVAIDDARAATLVGELNGILGHMDVLQRVELPPTIGAPALAGMPVRDDVPGAVSLDTPREQFAPTMREGFFLVPRLTTHSAAGASADRQAADGDDEVEGA